MCGIVGFVNFDKTISATRKKWFQQALYVDRLRGEDATGVCVVPRHFTKNTIESPLVYKRALASPDFLPQVQAQKVLKETDDCALAIGHNRWATKGKAGLDDNAHPFCFDDIIMVHNGTLITRNGLDKWDDVDSRAIAQQLAITDPTKYAELLSKLDGAFTLVWYNSTTEKVYMSRNNERPLWLATGYDNKTLYYASEPWMLSGLLERAGVKSAIDRNDKGYYNLWQMPVDHLYTIDLDGEGVVIDSEKYEPYIAPKGCGTGHNNGYSRTNYSGTSDTHCSAPLKSGEFALIKDWQWLRDSVNGKFGRIVGSEYMHPEIRIVIPNVEEAAYNAFYNKGVKLMKKANDDEFLMMAAHIYTIGNLSGTANRDTKWLANCSFSSAELALYTDEAENSEDDDDQTDGDNDNIPYEINGKTVSKDEWDRATNDGCRMCDSNIWRKERAGVTWIATIKSGNQASYEPICPSCSKHLDEQAGAI